jgi:hypothetical protein
MRFKFLATLALLFLSFQNCSNVDFSTTPDTSVSKANNGDDAVIEVDVEPNDDTTIGIDVDPDDCVCDVRNDRGPKKDVRIELQSPRRVCTSDGVQTLYAGQHHDVGDVTVSINAGILTVKVKAHPGILIYETHVNVGSTATGTAGPPGSFPYKNDRLGGVSEHSYQISLADHGLSSGPIFIAVHAVVAPEAGLEGEIIDGRETAWAEGERQGGGWQMVFQYAPNGCP